MTYYEEFGIPSSATPDEIHQAHRRLIKILHPDLQIEERARQLAEVQTRRINCIAEMLLDPVKRLEYERSLIWSAQFGPGHRVGAFGSKIQWGSLANFVITGMFVLAGLWILESDRPVAAHPPDAGSSPAPDSGSHPQPARAVPRPARSDRDSVPHEPHPRHRSGPEEESTPMPPSSTEASGTLEQHSSPPPSPAPIILAESGEPPRSVLPDPKPPLAQPPAIESQHTDRPSKDPENPYLGTWVYLPTPVTEDDQQVYRPEYIEMRIHEINGLLEGHYRARYHVPDRPLSPNVGFYFTGPLKQRSGAFHWTGSNGLAGDVKLNLLGANSIQVDWKVTELAQTADLVSGTAVLTRVR